MVGRWRVSRLWLGGAGGGGRQRAQRESERERREREERERTGSFMHDSQVEMPMMGFSVVFSAE